MAAGCAVCTGLGFAVWGVERTAHTTSQAGVDFCVRYILQGYRYPVRSDSIPEVLL